MNPRRTATAAGIGAVLGALWWATTELITSGRVCSTDDFQCLGVGLIAIPTAVILGATIAWLAMRSLHFPRPAAAAITGTALTTLFMILISVPAGAIVIGALGFAIGAAVTGTRTVSETAARD